MSTAADIGSKVRRVGELRVDLSTKNKNCYYEVTGSNTWWKGTAGDSLRTGYKDLKAEIDSLLKTLGSLSSALTTLKSRVEEAEREKKRLAEAATISSSSSRSSF